MRVKSALAQDTVEVVPLNSSESLAPPGTVLAEPAHNDHGLTLLMAVGCAVSVANIYYCQPLLAQMGATVTGARGLAPYIPTFSQVGTMLGMGLFVPLGDMFERRRLIFLLALAASFSALGTALSPNGVSLAAANFLLGLTAVVPHLILPLAAQLSRSEDRGRAVGSVISGILIGILCGRTFSGLVGASFGWRSVYWFGAGAMGILAYLLRKKLPETHPSATLTYVQLWRSLWHFVRDFSILRQAALTGAMLFGVFCAFWATLVFHLATPPFHYGSRVAGLFGLVGAAGAAAAPLIGRIADRRGTRATIGFALLLTTGSFGIFFAAGKTMWGLMIGVILMDLGVQAGHVSNQSRIYAILPEARSRLNTIYMVSYFLGGALGSALGAYGWTLAGWNGVCGVGIGMLCVALFVHYFSSGAHQNGSGVIP